MNYLSHQHLCQPQEKKQRHSIYIYIYIYMYKLRISCVYIALYGLQNCYPNITSVVQQIKRAWRFNKHRTNNSVWVVKTWVLGPVLMCNIVWPPNSYPYICLGQGGPLSVPAGNKHRTSRSFMAVSVILKTDWGLKFWSLHLPQVSGLCTECTRQFFKKQSYPFYFKIKQKA